MDPSSLNPFDYVSPEHIEYLVQKASYEIGRRRNAWKKANMEIEARRNAELHQSGIVSSFLFNYYELDQNTNQHLLRLNGQPYHLYVEPSWTGRMGADDVLVRPLKNEKYHLDLRLVELRTQYMDTLEKQGRKVYDADTFRLLNITTASNKWQLECGLGGYFNYLLTCENLSDELMTELRNERLETLSGLRRSTLSRAEQKMLERIRERLYSRKLLAPSLEALKSFHSRDCKIGLNVFLVLNTNSGPLCFLSHRGTNVGEYPDINHVMPAGTFQHDGKEGLSYNEAVRAFSIKYKVFSELWEECFEGKDMKTQRKMAYKGSIDLENVQTAGGYPIKDLMILLASNQAFLYVTGVGIDLLTAKPEVTIALIINDVGYERTYRNDWKVNWEFMGYERSDLTGVYFCRLDDTDKINTYIASGKVIPAGAMAVTRGFEVMSELRQENLIDFEVPTLEDR